MSIPGRPVLSVTTTFVAVLSMSMLEIAALLYFFLIKVLILSSSLMYLAKSFLFAYQEDCQPLLTPILSPTGLTFCPILPSYSLLSSTIVMWLVLFNILSALPLARMFNLFIVGPGQAYASAT